IDIAARNRDLTFLVHQEDVPVAHTVVEAITAALEPFLDSLELEAVLEPLGVGRKARSANLARIVLEGVEIPVGVRYETLPGDPLVDWHDLVQHGIVLVLTNVSDRRRRPGQVAPRRQNVLDLRNFVVGDLQSYS